MATITNNTKYTLAVLGLAACAGKDPQPYSKLVGAGASETVPDEVAKAWSEKAEVKAHGTKVSVSLDGKPTADGNPTAAESLPTVKDAVTAVGAMTDLDELEKLHTSETRPRVLKAIETRIEVLCGK